MLKTLVTALSLLLAACANDATEMDNDVLAAREVGNTGGLNYGEFGPADAYEDGSEHPFYGSENEWSRRMFSERAADLYYKRRGQRQMLEIIDGNPRVALMLADARLGEDPDDAESHYIRTVALTQMQDVAGALEAMHAALDAGLPFGRFLAGPRDLLHPLRESAEFRALKARQNVAIVHGPMLGAVTDRSTQFWIRSADEIEFEVLAEGGGKRRSARGSTRAADDFTGVVRVDGLDPDTAYSYRLHLAGRDEPEADVRHFRTSPVAGTRSRFVVGFGGCAGYTPKNERMWDTIAGHELRAFLFLGDNVYIDVPEHPGAIHEYSYYRRQSRPEFRRLVGEVPAYAIWDDHDAAFDDVWLGPYVDRPDWKRPMIDSFRQNWNNPSYGSATNPGTWFRFAIGDVDFFMLDGRTYRTNPFIDGRTMLGLPQKAWLLDGLKDSGATFKVIASPVAWADGAKPGSIDTWSGFPEEREEIFSFIETHDIEGVILLSSDRHRSEAWKIDRDSGYGFHDLMSGQLTNIHTHPVEEGALFSYNATDSFGMLSFDTARADPEMTYHIVSIDDETIYTLVLRRSDLRPRNRD